MYVLEKFPNVCIFAPNRIIQFWFVISGQGLYKVKKSKYLRKKIAVEFTDKIVLYRRYEVRHFEKLYEYKLLYVTVTIIYVVILLFHYLKF